MPHPLARYIFQNHFIAGILLIGLGWFLLEIRDILATLFISFIIMAALAPYVSFFKRQKFPHIFAVLIPYLTTLAIIILLIFPLIPFFLSQIHALFNNLPKYLDTAAQVFGIGIDQSQIQNLVSREIETIGRNAFTVTTRVFGGVFSTLTILVLSFYLLIDKDRIKRDILAFIPRNSHDKTLTMFYHIEKKLGAWLRGQLVLSLFIGVLTWVALTALGLPFALPLALIAGILEIVPTIGPIISSIPAIIVALTISPTLAVFVALIYIAIQILENNLLVPKIMEQAVGLNPIIIILGVMTGAKLMGVIGALLSVPFLAMLLILLAHIHTQET